MVTTSKAEDDLLLALRRHVAHGHGEILIQIRPMPSNSSNCSVRIQQGEGDLYEVVRYNP